MVYDGDHIRRSWMHNMIFGVRSTVLDCVTSITLVLNNSCEILPKWHSGVLKMMRTSLLRRQTLFPAFCIPSLLPNICRRAWI